MEEVIGARGDPERFEAFLEDWEAILARRVEQAVETVAAIPGVRGLVLVGSNGRGEPWPLSDIDLLPVYEDARMEVAQAEVERARLRIIDGWASQGWRTGLDIGRLAFGRSEVERVLAGSIALEEVLWDDRWYYSLDKGYQGRAVYDPEGLAAGLVSWFTRHRFAEQAVRFRLARTREEVDRGLAELQQLDSKRGGAKERRGGFPVRHASTPGSRMEPADPIAATKLLRSTVQWARLWLMERWGERDNSFGRVGTRFERTARDRGQDAIADELHALADLDGGSVERRMALAPEWVWERHDRSWRSRLLIGEEVTRHQDARDVLRVCSHYELRTITAPPVPEWLAVPIDAAVIAERRSRLAWLVAVVEV